ncbi:mitochondrial resolvase Ydc2, partial [Rhizodiscina lignyota]
SSVLTSLKLVHLRSLLAAIGANTGGTKPILISRLGQQLPLSKLQFHQDQQSSRTRILSLDMGIKNLAFCVCDVSTPALSSNRVPANNQSHNSLLESTEHRPGPQWTLAVQAWKRVSLMDLSPTSASPKDNSTDPEAIDPFHPRELSRLAYNLATDILLPYSADTILIERQRFRSGGAAAVQEWTVRVNMLESMLWAVLRTLEADSKNASGMGTSFPAVWDVSPARVGTFWVHGSGNGNRDSSIPTTRKVDKRDKIDFLRRWIANPERTIDLRFGREVESLRDAFIQDNHPKRRATAARRDIGKLDDLADCLLQAAAWVQWEANRQLISEMQVE